MVALQEKIASFWTNTVRVLRVTRKPSFEEFKTISKVAGAGLIIIGFLGFLIQIIFNLILYGRL